MQFTSFLQLIRWKNLLLVIYIQILIKFLFLKKYMVASTLSNIEFFTLLLALILIMAAGNIINDIFDVKADIINKPTKLIITKHITLSQAKKYYFILNTAGIILGVLFCLHIQKPSLSFIFITASLLLYYYSKKLKQTPLIGNFIVASLIAFSITFLIVFDTSINNQNAFVTTVIYLLATVAFFINITREIVKDIEDVNGDYNLKMNTLPILIGRDRSKKIALILSLFPIVFLFYILLNYAKDYKFTMLYLLVSTLIPLLIITVKIFKARSKKDYKKISALLKIVMFFGINVLLTLSLI